MKILVTRKVEIPEGCKYTLEDKVFTFEGPKGKIVHDCKKDRLTFDIVDNAIRIRVWHADTKQYAMINTTVALLNNSITAVMEGFAYTMKAVSNHFSINLEVQDNGKTLIVKNFLGEKSAKVFKMYGCAKVKLGDAKDTIVIEGPSLPDVSLSAGVISNRCKPTNRDSRIFLDGIFVIERGVMA